MANLSKYAGYAEKLEERENVIIKRAAKAMTEASEERSAARRRSAANRKYKEITTQHNHLKTSLALMVKQFSEEISGKPLHQVDYTNKDSVAFRKNQMSVYKDTMVMFEMLDTLIRKLETEHDLATPEREVVEDETVKLMASARKLLRKQGVKTEE